MEGNFKQFLIGLIVLIIVSVFYFSIISSLLDISQNTDDVTIGTILYPVVFYTLATIFINNLDLYIGSENEHRRCTDINNISLFSYVIIYYLIQKVSWYTLGGIASFFIWGIIIVTIWVILMIFIYLLDIKDNHWYEKKK